MKLIIAHYLLISTLGLCVGLAASLASGHEPAGNLNFNCFEIGISLIKRHDSNGFQIYSLLNEHRKEKFKSDVSDCRSENDLAAFSVAVHEATHAIDSRHSDLANDRYYINRNAIHLDPTELLYLSGDFLSSPVALFPPVKVATNSLKTVSPALKKLESLYLAGEFGEKSLYFLLKELNGYTQEGFTLIQLANGRKQQATLNSGLLQVMLFLEHYIKTLRTQYPEDWNELQKPEYRTAILVLWRQAEEVLNQGLSSSYVLVSNAHLRQVYSPANINELGLAFISHFKSTLSPKNLK